MPNIANIFDSLLPQNIKDIQLVKDAQAIFVKMLEDHCDVAQDVYNVYDTPLTVDSTIGALDVVGVPLSDPTPTETYLNNSNSARRIGLLDTYMSELHAVIVNAQNNQHLEQKLISLGIDKTSVLNRAAERILNEDFVLTYKTFKENVGTIGSIFWMYDVACKFENLPNHTKPTVVMPTPFHLDIQGELSGDMYRAIVEPLTHPAGFTYTYTETSSNTNVDTFGVQETYTVESIEVRGINGDIYVFDPNPPTNNTTASATVNAQSTQVANTTRFNATHTTQPLTPQQVLTNVRFYNSKVVSRIVENSVGGRYILIVFTDDTFIQQLNNQVVYGSYSTWLTAPTELIVDFTPPNPPTHHVTESTIQSSSLTPSTPVDPSHPPHYAVYAKYTTSKVPAYTDTFSIV